MSSAAIFVIEVMFSLLWIFFPPGSIPRHVGQDGVWFCAGILCGRAFPAPVERTEP